METLGLRDAFAGSYAGRRVMVTGHTGFKGSWLALWLHALGAEVGGLSLAPDTEPSHWELLSLDIDADGRVDLCDGPAVLDAVVAFRPEIVFHLAAQPLVRRAYREPVATFATNVMGVVHLLDAVRACPTIRVVVNATTDKVYEPSTAASPYTEEDPLGGHDPYSTSKACAELVSASYRRSYFDVDGRVRLATARAGNVIGGGDWAEDRLVPDLIRAAVAAAPLHLRNPQATRPWQHVLEPLSGYLRVGQALLDGEVAGGAWNFGPSVDATLTVEDVAGRLARTWPDLRVEHDRGPHPHEATELALDCSKATAELAWRPVWDADTTFARTAEWYRAFTVDGFVRSSDDLSVYVEDARRAEVGWAG